MIELLEEIILDFQNESLEIGIKRHLNYELVQGRIPLVSEKSLSWKWHEEKSFIKTIGNYGLCFYTAQGEPGHKWGIFKWP